MSTDSIDTEDKEPLRSVRHAALINEIKKIKSSSEDLLKLTNKLTTLNSAEDAADILTLLSEMKDFIDVLTFQCKRIKRLMET